MVEHQAPVSDRPTKAPSPSSSHGGDSDSSGDGTQVLIVTGFVMGMAETTRCEMMDILEDSGLRISSMTAFTYSLSPPSRPVGIMITFELPGQANLARMLLNGRRLLSNASRVEDDGWISHGAFVNTLKAEVCFEDELGEVLRDPYITMYHAQ